MQLINSAGNVNPIVTLTAAVTVPDITFTSSNVTFAGAFAITTNNMTLDNSQVAFANSVTINSALTFSGTTTAPRFTAGFGPSNFGNGGAFTLTGNSATNYFDGTANSSFRYNTTSALTVFFKTSISMSDIAVYKGLITLGNNVSLPRLNFPATSLNNQELILAPNVTLTLSSSATSTYTELAGGGAINASASGSKVLITSTAVTVLTTTGRIFKENTTINHLEVNTTGNLILAFPITVGTLTKTAGTITTTVTNTISIAPGGNVVEGTGIIVGPAVIPSTSTTRYWVGGATGNWSNAASWGTSSGDMLTPGIPEYGDNVVFDNSAGNVNPIVTLTAAVTVPDITFTSSNVTFAGAFDIICNNLTVTSSQITFVDDVTVNSSIAFTGTTPRITQLSATSGRAFKMGNGGAFTLTGNSASNYFNGSGNTYYSYNTTSPLTVFFNPSAPALGAIVVDKGLITLGNNISALRLTLTSTNSQELILGENVTFSLTGSGTSSFTATANGGVVNASASGSKFLMTSTAVTVLTTAGRIFKENTTINHLEVNTTGNLILAFPITVLNVTKTAGTITTSSTNTLAISIAVPRTASDIFTDTGADMAVSSTLTMDVDKTVNSVTVNAGGKINLSPTKVLTVNGNLDLKADLSNSFSINLGSSNISVPTGTFRYLKTIDDTKWFFISFPCNIDIASITESNGASLGDLGTHWFLKYYDGQRRANLGTSSGSNWTDIRAADLATTPNLLANQGYIIGLATNSGVSKEIAFPLDKAILSGEASKTSIPISVNSGTAATTNHGWNLVGAPYISKYDMAGAGVLSIYFANTSNGYDYYLPSDGPYLLNPFSGYFVQSSGNTSFSFDTALRQSVQSSVATNTSDNVQLNLSSAAGTDRTNIIINNLASPAYVLGQDLEKWMGSSTTIYTKSEGLNFALNALPLSSVDNLPVDFYTKTAGQATISANAARAPGLSNLLLTDNATSPATTTDLLVSNYSFTAAAGTTANRFFISARKTITSNQLNGQENENGQKMSIINSKLIIENLATNSVVRIFDTLGHTLYNKTSSNNTLEIKLTASGIYIVQIEKDGTNWVKKILSQ